MNWQEGQWFRGCGNRCRSFDHESLIETLLSKRAAPFASAWRQESGSFAPAAWQLNRCAIATRNDFLWLKLNCDNEYSSAESWLSVRVNGHPAKLETVINRSSDFLP
jgi:hypothetical protein